MTIQRILFPTDFSQQSFEALDYASQLARAYQAELHFAYVDDIPYYSALVPYCCPNFVSSVDRSEVELALFRLKPTMPKIVSAYHYLQGDPAAEICALAKKDSFDLIVMSSHGRTGLTHLLVGSVAEEVLRSSPCPVFVIKHRTGEPTEKVGDEAGSNLGCEPATV